MAITLTNATNPASTTTLTLPDALNWVDEYAWSPVVQAKTYTTTGALLIEEATKQAGRPVSLEGSEDKTWCTREVVDSLRGWAATAGLVLTLTLRGVARQVVFDHERGALQGIPVFFYTDAAIAADDFYVPTLRFVQL